MYNHAPKDYQCPFCRLVKQINQEDIDRTVYQDDFISALVPLHKWPNNPGHVLIVPNRHYENIYDLPVVLSAKIHECAQAVALVLKNAYGCDGVSTRQHNAPAGGQDVWHYHLHVFPRYESDRLYLTHRERMTAEEINKYAGILCAEMKEWEPTILF